MKIEAFHKNYCNEAMEIVLSNYREEQKYNPYLPDLTTVPDLSIFADFGLGAAAIEDNRLLGFLCAYPPIDDAFATTNVKGTFSPIHAHGVLLSDNKSMIYSRDRIYSGLYQAAAQRWVQEGILSHAIALFTHDSDAVKSFFYNGFGLRCIDAIRTLSEIPEWIDTSLKLEKTMEYQEVPRQEWGLLLEYHNSLIAHLGNSPTFMKYPPMDEKELYRRTSEDVRYFAAKADGQYIAFIKIADNGENFITEDDKMVNICGAYCSPIYRGMGIYHNLLCYLMTVLKSEGYKLLGVDYESINPTARGFWSKYFREYTNSVVRRIDDKVISAI